MWMVLVRVPDSIWSAIEVALAIGIAKPVVSALLLNRPELDEAAVFMPITVPVALSYSAPPESPGWMLAFTWIIPVSRSALLPLSSLAVMDWLIALTVPDAAVGVPPVPPALPTAVTAMPTLTLDESPSLAVASPLASLSWITATSSVGSVPTTVAV